MVKIIAEIGINHRGSVDVAEELAYIASASGAWGVKFQYRSSDFYYSVSEIGDEIISQELERSYIPPDDILDIARKAKRRGLQVGISFFKFSDTRDFGSAISEFDFFKIPSAELKNSALIGSMASLGKPLIVSTGGHEQEEIFEVVRKTKHIPKIIYLHCISNYPVLVGNQQMLFLRALEQVAGTPVGYSSHDQDWEVCLVAVANGAEYIERHLTLDKNGPGLDDSSSSDPEEFGRLCKLAKAFPGIQGDGTRHVNQGELINMQNLGSSLYAMRDIAAGEQVDLSNCEIRAPKKGLTLSDLEKMEVCRAQRPVRSGSAIAALHFSAPKPPLCQDLRVFCDESEVSLPIRLHDAESIQERFPIQNFELHLSYGEVEFFKTSKVEFLSKFRKDKKYSIHLPDYIGGNRLINPLSQDPSIHTDSRETVATCVAIARELELVVGAKVPVVGSFSRLLPAGKFETYRRLIDYLSEIRDQNEIEIYPQWLPRIAWYFGGAEVLNMFCGNDDIQFIRELGLEICLDLSHLILSANYEKADWRDWCARLQPFAKHVHIADATGIDGEGIEFGKGDLGCVEPFLQWPGRKVLEVWQGHLSEGDGFEKAIRHLAEENSHSAIARKSLGSR